MDLKNEWKQTGEELVGALSTLGKTLIRTAQIGIKKADEWANGTKEEPEKDDDPAES